jgi:hypothetical protein
VKYIYKLIVAHGIQISTNVKEHFLIGTKHLKSRKCNVSSNPTTGHSRERKKLAKIFVFTAFSITGKQNVKFLIFP